MSTDKCCLRAGAAVALEPRLGVTNGTVTPGEHHLGHTVSAGRQVHALPLLNQQRFDERLPELKFVTRHGKLHRVSVHIFLIDDVRIHHHHIYAVHEHTFPPMNVFPSDLERVIVHTGHTTHESVGTLSEVHNQFRDARFRVNVGTFMEGRQVRFCLVVLVLNDYIVAICLALPSEVTFLSCLIPFLQVS